MPDGLLQWQADLIEVYHHMLHAIHFVFVLFEPASHGLLCFEIDALILFSFSMCYVVFVIHVD